MASSQDEDDWDDDWDKSTSEVQSEDSDELFDNRPNRWRGPPQSWRTITEEDRLTYNALERLRNQDLSVHLYNDSVLRQTPQQANEGAVIAREKDVDAETGRPVAHGEPWVPPKSWTAWPLSAQLVPPDEFMKKTEDEDEIFTFRRPERDAPSCKLEEIVSANILRVAKEKFSKRRFSETPPPSNRGKVKLEALSSENEFQPSEAESEDEAEMDPDKIPRDQPQRKTRAPMATFKPTVATDEDVSYELIRPSARGILEKLDQTLSILHNARMTSAQNIMDFSDSSSEDYDEHDSELYGSRPTSRASHGRSRSRSVSRNSTPGGEPTTTTEAKKSRRGRPPKYVQMEGESMQDFLLRRAKAMKKKHPVALEADDESEYSATTATEAPKSPRRRRRRRTRPREGMTEEKEYWMQKKMERLNLRDWSDVMGAAALAGFSPGVIARATQRCANLFGQGMEMHTINETAASSGVNGIETTRYEPGHAVPSSSSESDQENENLDKRQARSMSRGTSLAPSRAVSSALSEGGDEETQPQKKRQKRSSFSGPVTGQHPCPHADCPRAMKGFDRPYNLKRHLKLVHGQDSAEEVKAMPVVEDDLDGGVHRDGFLEPIRTQRGWRAEDSRKRAVKWGTGKRPRYESSADDDGSDPEGDGKVKLESDSES